MRVHFLYWHVLDNVVILEEGNLPHRRYTRYNMLVPRWELNSWHPAIAQCARGGGRKRRQLAEEELREILEWAFEAYGEPLENMMAFQYLGQVLLVGYDDWIVVLGNLGKARKSLGQLLWILSREGEDLKVSGHFYKEVSQAVLLFRARSIRGVSTHDSALNSNTACDTSL